MATAQNYPVSFGYRAQDGYYYATNVSGQATGIVGDYHRGHDRACPTGTPVVIDGVTIGLTGATGAGSSAHLHTQAWASLPSQTIDPTNYEFRPGRVIQVGTSPTWGKYVTIRVGSYNVTYAHLSEIHVAVGTDIVQPPEMIKNLYPLQALFVHFRGRLPNDEEVAMFLNKVSYESFIPMLDSGDEHKAMQIATGTGQMALRDDWQGQIESLYKELNGLRVRAAELADRPTKESFHELEDKLAACLATTQKVSDTMAGLPQAEQPNWLIRLLAKLFIKD